MNDSPYEILGISKNATEAEIRKAYLIKAKQTHPDKNKKKDAQEQFTKVTYAYETLINDSTKSYNDFEFDILKGMKIFEDVFDNYVNHKTKGDDIYREILITLEQIYKGCEIKLEYEKNVIDPLVPVTPCHICNGDKFVMIMNQLNSMLNNSKMENQLCTNCKGTGITGNIVTKETLFYIDIPEGTEDYKTFKFEGHGHQSVNNDSGNLIVKIITKPNRHYTRKGNDLYKNVSLSLKQSLLGFDYKFKLLDGTEKNMHIEGILKPGCIKEIQGLGMPYKNLYENLYGNLYLKMKVNFPDKLNGKQKRLINKIF